MNIKLLYLLLSALLLLCLAPMPYGYYQLVRLAKEANACWKIRKTVLVDLEKIEIYLETFRKGSDKENVKAEK